EGTPGFSNWIGFLASVIFDDLLLLEELRKILSFRQSDDLAFEILNVRIDISRNWSAFKVICSGHSPADFSIAHLNFVADFQLEARNVDNTTIYENVAMVDHLP